MPALRKLLHTGTAILLTAAIAIGQGYEAAALSSDSNGNDRMVSTALAANVQRPAATIRVKSITPNFSKRIAEKFEINDDTIGWLYVPGTSINHVILKNPFHQTNNYYLGLNINKRPDKNGMFCADFRAVFGSGKRKDLSRITALYGHSWTDDPDDILFAQLKKYRDHDFAKNNPYIFFSTAKENMAWEVFAVFDTTIDLPYISPTLPDIHFYDMLDIVKQLSYYENDIAITADDKILTLSTCTYSVMGHERLPELNGYRFAIMARLVKPNDAIKTEAALTINEDRLAPDGIAAISAEKKLPRW